MNDPKVNSLFKYSIKFWRNDWHPLQHNLEFRKIEAVNLFISKLLDPILLTV